MGDPFFSPNDSRSLMNMARLWVRIALLNLILAAVLGFILRYAFVVELSWMKYTDVMHAHSHMAMLGWGYMVVFALIYYLYRESLQEISGRIHWLFIALEVSSLGIFSCFPFFGYGIPTITFLSIHMLLSYYFIYLVWRRIPKGEGYRDNYWMKAALFFLILSTIGIWVIAPIFALGLGKTIWYYLAVQFFLHFEINAWFLFAALALFFAFIRNSGIELPGKRMKYIFWLFFISCILTYALAVAWSNNNWLVSTINTSGVVLQAIGAGLLFYMLWPHRKKILHEHTDFAKSLFLLAFLAFSAKIVIQLLLVLPAFMEVAYTIRNFVVGFIHLILLGIFTPYVISYIRAEGVFSFSKRANAGIVMIIIGFVLSELIIFAQGGMFWMAWGFLPFYYSSLAIVSLLLPVGLILLLWGLKMPISKNAGEIG